MTPRAVKLIAGGDLCPADHYFTLGHGFARPERVANALNALAPLLRQADVAIANLEAPLSHSSDAGSRVGKQVFLGHPEAASIIKRSGINYLQVANNHILQHGPRAFNDTIAELKKVGIRPLGISDARSDISPLYCTANGLKLVFAGVSFVPDPFCPDQTSYDNPKEAELVDFVERASKHADHVIVSVHWGLEGPDLPAASEVLLGRRLVDAGASVVLGHHPHIVRPVETRGAGIICYSLGNLLFNLEWYHPYSIGMLIEITLGPKGTPPAWTPHFTQCKNNLIRLLSREQNGLLLNELEATARCVESTGLATLDEMHDTRLRLLENRLKWKKLLFFLRMLLRGGILMKLSFLFNKLTKRRA